MSPPLRDRCPNGHDLSVTRGGSRPHRTFCSACKQQRSLDRPRDDEHLKSYRESQRRYRNKLKYKISEDEYQSLLERQDGRCAICGAVPNGKDLHVDHDHATGVVRGFLCSNCNTGIGLFRDNPTLLEIAASYLISGDST